MTPAIILIFSLLIQYGHGIVQLPDGYTAFFRQGVLDSHNVYRSRHGAGPLTMSASLNDLAQREAVRLATIGRMETTNSALSGYGRNFGYAGTIIGQDYTGR
jgi:uncharacterized protein YkwD